ncbi:MAG: phosphatase PAP2 family protein [Microlunatus sp.]|nr:phosphatase PAP2 family protein [Microlunatus sp.]MDN5771567.1 phosphatase PAP2 family protein [Microlunatus sp.]MDN5803561.1 phosphatase PAP2 family protein [Microlunatus sp.]
MSRRRSRTSILIVVSLLLAFVGWTALVFNWPALGAADQRYVATPLEPNSAAAQIMAAFALLTWPGLEYAALVGLAIWAFRRRLRALASALLLTVALGWVTGDLLKLVFRRERPPGYLDVLTAVGYSYPSGHMVGVVASCIAVGATFRVTRRSPRARGLWTLGASLLILLVAFDRWLLGAHHVGDIVGGALLGGFVGTFALVACGVAVPIPHTAVVDLVRERREALNPRSTKGQKRCAVIYNPVKVTDWAVFRRHVEYELRDRGWQRPLWLETTVDDSGRAMTAQAVAEKVDLVIGAGGDGTIRVICSGLAGTGIPFGLIPAGTSNLLARNIGIPRDEAAALRVAFDGQDKPIDLVRVRVDSGEDDRFAVMAGIGLDAVIMQGTNPDLKKTVGSAAYFVSAAKHANHPALQATVRVDEHPPLRRKAHLIVVGNVGLLPSGILLIPDAKPDDGLLDVLVASPRTVRDWVRLVAQVVTRQQRSDEQLDRMSGRRVQITVEPSDQYQLDGDTVGETSTLIAEIEPAALTLRVPPIQRRSLSTRESADLSSVAAGEPEPVSIG